MSLQLIAISAVLLGTLILFFSLLPAWKISRLSSQGLRTHGWRILFVLICLFIVGYITFALIVLQKQVSAVDVVVATILLGGSVFVFLVIRMSLISIQDVNRIAAQERHQALHDELTNLPNRSLLYERIEQGILSARRRGSELVVLMMDLNQFKEVNDTLGHHCGDVLLQKVAMQLCSVVRASDTVARLGGDEFAIVLPDTSTKGAVLICQKIMNVMSSVINVEGHALKIGISVGVAVFPKDGEKPELLMQRADVAMYVAKNDDSGYAIYHPARDQYTVNRLRIISELHDAILNKQLTLNFQPIVNIDNSKLWGFEVLSRWQHEQLGEVSPVEFITIAEQSGLIKQLTLWMLETAFMQYAKWRTLNYDFKLSVNISVKDIQDEDFPEKVRDLLKKTQMVAGNVHVEITESSVMSNTKRAYQVISELRSLGINISIDDFGTGYSSLSYLKQLPTQSIKIDRGFISNMLDDDNDAIIVRSTIDLAHNMGRVAIAEGVEDKDTLEILEILGCDYAQGYFISKPMPVENVSRWLLAYHNRKILGNNASGT